MKYKTSTILNNWQNQPTKMHELTAHADSKTAKKTTLAAILAATNAERLLGCKVRKVGKQKLATPPRQQLGLTPALVEALDDNADSLPALLSTYYPNVYQRADYPQAVNLALRNMLTIDFLTDRHHKTTPASQRKLFQVFSRDDIYRKDKRILADVARAVSLALLNQVGGLPLTKMAGRGLYLNHGTIRECMERPTEASDESLSNALTLLQVAGYLHFAQDKELTDAGLKLSEFTNQKGYLVKTHKVYVVSDFDAADWNLVQRSFRLDLNTRIGHDVLANLLGQDVASAYFPGLTGGATGVVIGFIASKVNDVGDNTPVMTLKSARDTTESITGVAQATASKWVDQALMVKPVQAMKMTAKEARENGFNLDEWQAGSPAEKLIVPVTADALLMCISRLKRANKKGVQVSQLMDD